MLDETTPSASYHTMHEHDELIDSRLEHHSVSAMISLVILWLRIRNEDADI